ncbi:uncharacterized protein B0P05DRAFT_560226 [Gilbertella persicaria]|uniref:Uncharacterized protein n=1 Tax=Rhizopus stolonifer TaxID=4846 RepID=A0A367IMI0_RHIST|nr:uncharacterized protein B0P05DRAFT_560226 [Gilbertella persicaria]KAI8056286.1 hypothetical protein B0P05DRAFT_560226 [Gilbertella persicaria]RCH78878.1 hypothetical protein CU098_006988 [Rhizopus stolonifer]
MIMDTCQTKASIYDTIPHLDSWYQNKTATVVPCVNQKKRKTCSNTVSFSDAPPSVYCYQEPKERPTPLKRNNSSSEQVKGLLRYCTSKLARQRS